MGRKYKSKNSGCFKEQYGAIMIEIAIIVGTRPDVIKLCPLIKTLEKSSYVQPFVISTGQHRDMLNSVFRLFDVKVDVDLDIMQDNQTPIYVLNESLTGMDRIFSSRNIDCVLVQGDTTTSYAGALAAFYSKIPIGHVEAGLRTNMKYSPFPEEINRRMITSVADIHFAPTETNKKNLIREGISEEKIFVTGNTVIDAFLTIIEKVKKEQLPTGKNDPEGSTKKTILVTAHRRENWERHLNTLCLALKRISDNHSDVEIVFPVHPNPEVRKVVHSTLRGTERINLIDPLDYLDFTVMMFQSYLIITDSGGIQEEGPAIGKPVLVVRECTERPEGIQAGTVSLVELSEEGITESVGRLLLDDAEYQKMAKSANPYGDGMASERIMQCLHYYFQKTPKRPDPFSPQK